MIVPSGRVLKNYYEYWNKSYLFDILVIEVDNCIAVRINFSLDTVGKDYFFLAVGEYSLNLSIFRYILRHDFITLPILFSHSRYIKIILLKVKLFMVRDFVYKKMYFFDWRQKHQAPFIFAFFEFICYCCLFEAFLDFICLIFAFLLDLFHSSWLVLTLSN